MHRVEPTLGNPLQPVEIQIYIQRSCRVILFLESADREGEFADMTRIARSATGNEGGQPNDNLEPETAAVDSLILAQSFGEPLTLRRIAF